MILRKTKQAGAIIYILILISIGSSWAEEEVQKPESCAKDFQVMVSSQGGIWTGEVYKVSKTISYSVTIPGVQTTAAYDFFYFVDNRLKRSRQDVTLPFQFKQTFRGVSPGVYALSFILKSKSGECGIETMNIRVNHED